jgi:hypothetical protein
MNRIGIRSLATVAIATFALTGFGVQGAGATATTTAQPAAVAGPYTFYLFWTGYPPSSGFVTLNRNHTGSDTAGDTITWSKTGRSVTVTIANGLATATYLGRKTKTGLNNVRHPGTMSNDVGGRGTFYAVKT